MKEKLIFDGAFGTYIASKGFASEQPELCNITHPDEVLRIHSEYIESGANAIKTNTFGANPESFPDRERLSDIISHGYSLALTAAADSPVRAFADIGPIAGDTPERDYMTVADIFIGLGCTDFLFETQSEAESLEKAIKHIKSLLPESDVIVSFAVGQDGFSKTGNYYMSLLEAADSYGADHVGLNCICGPTHMLELMSGIPAGRFSLTAMPNSGYPSVSNGRTVYIDNPDYFAEKLNAIASLGVDITGGCCGTTPMHIKRYTELSPDAQLPRASSDVPYSYSDHSTSKSFDKPFIAVELPAPTDTDTSYLIDAVTDVKNSGADYVTIPDSPLGKSRANSMMISAYVMRHVGIPAIPHVCCRDKNRIAIKGDLIAGNIEGISHVLAITGDSVSLTERDDAKNVFVFNSYKLIQYIDSLNGLMFNDQPYSICAALNTSAQNFDAELRRAEEKIKRGAVCMFTQPLYSDTDIDNYLLAKKSLGCRIAAGILPVAGYKNALYLNNEVAGITIPDSVLSSLYEKSPEDAKKISIAYSKDIISRIIEGCDGFYIMTPLKKTDFSCELSKFIKENL